MSIIFHHAPMSSAGPVAWALAELAVPHERVLVDLEAGDQRKPEFLKLNPNGKVPTLVVDGVPMFEALAINLFLGDRFGVEKKLWPSVDDPARPQAMAWSTWAYVTLGAALRGFVLTSSDRFGLRDEAHADFQRKELAALFAIVDAHLADRPYMLGEAFSLADLIVASVIGYAAMIGAPVASHARVTDWLARCQARPSLHASMA